MTTTTLYARLAAMTDAQLMYQWEAASDHGDDAHVAAIEALWAARRAADTFEARLAAVETLTALGWTVDAAFAHVDGTCDRYLCSAHDTSPAATLTVYGR